MTDENPDGYPSLREAVEAWHARRAPKDIVKSTPVPPDAPPIPIGRGGDVTYIELDHDGIPRQYTETAAAIAKPIGGEES